MKYYRFIACCCSFAFIAFSCNNNAVEKNNSGHSTANQEKVNAPLKPPSNYQDTLRIHNKSAVFYYPDSLQLEKLKQIIDSNVFAATMHEYFFQIRNARRVMGKNWPGIKVIEAKNVRYILFDKRDNRSELIDLDKKGDPYGLFLFDGEKVTMADMMNIDNELSRYFGKN